MPSVLVGNTSGGMLLISGNPWSGNQNIPVGSVLLKRDVSAGGMMYVGFSGGITMNSGGHGSVSGGTQLSGMLDGIPLAPGDSYSVPRRGTGPEGRIQIYAAPDAQASGSRLYFEVF